MTNAQIEALAYEIKNADLTANQRVRKSSQLLTVLMQQRWVGDNCNVELFDAYRSAMSRYGVVDSSTKQLIPFMQLFRHAFKLKKNTILKNQLEDSCGVAKELQRKKLVEAIRAIQEAHGIKRLDIKINVMNQDNALKLLADIKATEEEVEWLKSIYQETVVCADYESDNENTEKALPRPSDASSLSDQKAAERAINALVEGIDHVLGGIDKGVREYAIWFLTLKLRGYSSTYSADVEKYIDKKFLSFCNQDKRHADDVTLLAEFANIKYDTARKKLRKMELLFRSYKAA